ncbi:MAG: PDZ domain-containing protein [Myxococcales bacterium]|nr:PDZ domain-containing protein [Myxococcales bacterium]
MNARSNLLTTRILTASAWSGALTLALGLSACDPEPVDEREAEVEVDVAKHAASPVHAGAAPKVDDHADKEELHAALKKGAHAPMPGAEKAFFQALDIIGERYVDPVDREALFTGALEGVMGRLIQIDGHPINVLLSPEELDELLSGTKGTIVGVGVMIEFVADVLVVRDVIPGGAAAAAGLQRGDRILGIDGDRVAGMDLHEVVGRIRGPAGSEVVLFVQRDTEEWDQKLTRDVVTIRNVEAKMLDPEKGLGYLRLRGFAETTADELDAALEELAGAGMKRLVIDVRHCPGGLLDAAVTITSRFLRDGDAVVAIADRHKGDKELRAEGDGRWRELPMAVLVGPKTASSAEILADALATHAGATLIGAPSMGKGSVESIHELDNGWALKLSSGRFVGASGELRLGHGVRPHLPVSLGEDHGHSKPAALDDVGAGDDVALELARSWLSGERR